LRDAVVVRVWVVVAFAGMAMAPGAAAAGSCGGEACAAIAASADGCAVTNKSDKPVSLTTVAEEAALLMTVLSPGETIKQDKALCEKFARGEARYTAKFAALRTMPEAPDFTLKAAAAAPKPAPKPKPAAAPEAPTAAPAPAPVAVAAATPATPRFKPAPQSAIPAPREKPAAPALAATPAASATPAVAAIAPSAAAPPAEPAPCGEACATILFKVVDECLWVVNLHPRPVAFQAEAEGKRFNLMLEAADGEKADARTKAQTSKGETALHMRLHDPFQSAGSGIPIYRAKLGGAATCVKQRTDVASFTARFAN
jgi:hypothetical protein